MGKKLSLKAYIKNPYILIFLFTSILFAIHYGQFIFGTKAFVFIDLGSDTFNINYPLYNMFQRYFHSPDYSAYMLDAGVGMDTTFYLFQYLFPMNLMVVLLPARYMLQGMIISTYLKVLIINILSYKLFYKVLGHMPGALTGAFAWTFCGYLMLWGQHYGFLSAMMMFTGFAFLVYVYVVDEEKSRNYFLIPWITLMLFSNYYFLYMAGVFAVLFIIIYMLAKKKGFWPMLKKLLGLAGMALLGAMIGGICLVSCMDTFLDSARSSVLSSSGLLSYLRPYGKTILVTNAARLFSNNTLGMNLGYTGELNYYEAAQLSVSALFFASVPYLMVRKETRWRTILGVAVSSVMLVLPITGKLLNMNHASFRWTYILCFFQALAIGVFIKYLYNEEHKWRILISSVVGFVAWGVIIVAVKTLAQSYQMTAYGSVLKLVLLFMAMYALISCGMVWFKKLKRLGAVAMFAVLCVEVICCNWHTIHDRMNPNRIDLNEGAYHDGSGEIYAKLSSADSSVFRLTKGSQRLGYNDGMASGYPEISVYMSTNAQEIADYKNMYGADSISDNHIKFMESNYILSALMGTKYMMTASGRQVSQENYSYLFTEGQLDAYEKNQSLPFGYLYDQVISKSDVQALSIADRTLSALDGFYTTHSKQADVMSGYAMTSYDKDEEVSLKDQLEAVDGGAVIRDLQKEAWLGNINTLTVTMKETAGSQIKVNYGYKDQEPDQGGQLLLLSTDGQTYSCLLEKDVDCLMIPGDPAQIEAVTVMHAAQAEAAFEALKTSGVTETSFRDSTYRATVNNQKNHTQMLCVPLFHSKGWQARVDGVQVPYYNINSGFVGVEIPAGQHEVEISYHVPHLMAGIAMTVMGIIIYILLIIKKIRERKKS